MKNQHELKVLDGNGDTTHAWDTPDEAQAVESVFKTMLSRGYTAARMGADGTAGEKITAFDAAAGCIIMIPVMRGG